MLKIEGFDELNRTLEEAQRGLADLEGEIGTVSFDPDDPASIEAAIQRAHSMVDEKLGAYAGNSIVAPLIEASKEQFRDAIIEQASTARLKGESDDGQQN